ncbi:MAG: DUF6088 family protein [bacterium]
MQSVEQQILSRIYGTGRDWIFSQSDFADLGTRAAIDKSLQRLDAKGTIRRVIRGIYYYPKYSKMLNVTMGPDMDTAMPPSQRATVAVLHPAPYRT